MDSMAREGALPPSAVSGFRFDRTVNTRTVLRRLHTQVLGLRAFASTTTLATASATTAEMDEADDESSPGPAASNDEVLEGHAARLVSVQRRDELDAAVTEALRVWPGGCGMRPPRRTSDPSEAAKISL